MTSRCQRVIDVVSPERNPHTVSFLIMGLTFDLPDSYRLVYLKINDTWVRETGNLTALSDTDNVLIEIEPIHTDPGFSKPEQWIVTGAELREMAAQSPKNRLSLVVDVSGGPGVSAGEVELGRELVERHRRNQTGSIGARRQPYKDCLLVATADKLRDKAIWHARVGIERSSKEVGRSCR